MEVNKLLHYYYYHQFLFIVIVNTFLTMITIFFMYIIFQRHCNYNNNDNCLGIVNYA